MEAEGKARITIGASELLCKDEWLSFKRKHFVDREGKPSHWTYAERNGERAAVAVVARTRRTGRLVLIRQFRVPLEGWVWEFPAGLVDPGEDLADTARRELLEETGYHGRVLKLSLALPTSPGMVTERVHFALMEVEETPRESAHEAAESIEVHCLELAPPAIRAFLEQAERAGDSVDAKLWIWLEARLAD